MKRTLLLLAVLTAGLRPGRADAAAPITLAPMFRDHAVLQRDVPLPIWGTAEPDTIVEIGIFPARRDPDCQVDTLTNAVVGADGRWSAVLPAFPANADESRLLFWNYERPPAGKVRDLGKSLSSLLVTNVLFGDVWLCSGQSNMDMNYGWGLTRGKEDIETNTHARIRLFDDRNRTALSPQRDLPDDYGWTPCDPAHAKSFSAVGYFFGQALQEAMPDVPIGLVEASWSGSPIKTWIPYEAAETLGGDFGKQAAERRAIAEAWENGGAEQFKIDLAAWMEKLDGLCKEADGEADWTQKLGSAPAPAHFKFDDSDWKTATLPEITEKHESANFDGVVWYRRTFVIDKAVHPAFNRAWLTLGPIDDQDWTYVNGVLVGSTNMWDVPRSYEIDSRIIHQGTNVVAVKVLDWGGHGGLWSKKPDDLSLHLAEITYVMSKAEGCDGVVSGQTTIPLAGEWKFKAFPAEPRPKDLSGSGAWDIAGCHNGMVAPLFGMAAKGAIWYQGCSDVGNADLYAKQFPAMVGAWRKGFVHDDAGFPVYLVQLAAFKETHAEPIDSAWARMRWTQMRLGETVPHCGTAVAIDVGDHRDIHPKDKKTVGERLARLALARTYQGHKDDGSGPIPLSAAVRADASYPEPAPVIVRFVRPDFSDALRLATSDGQAVRGFQFVYEDGSAEAAAAEIDRYAVLLFPKDKTPVRVRYAWDDYPDCNLVNGEGLPCGPFELEIER